MKKQSSGFTLVELLVVITIIGILMGLLIPAVNAARESARRNQCSTQIKNLALAAIQFENTKQALPGYLQSFGTYAPASGSAFDPTDPSATAAPPAHVKLGSWPVALLPWLDAQPTYEHWTEDRYPVLPAPGGQYAPGTSAVNGTGAGFHPLAAPNLAIMQCPSNPNTNGDDGRNSYVGNNGMVPVTLMSGGNMLLNSMDRANGAFNNKYQGTVAASNPIVGPPVRLDDFKDGQGNTMLFSENVQAMPWHLPGLVNASHLVLSSGATNVGYSATSRYSQGMVWHYKDPDAANGAMAGSWNHLGTNNSITPTGVGSLLKINGAGASVSESIFVLKMNSSNAADLARPSSAHVDGVNAGMGVQCRFTDGLFPAACHG